jgi:hypothetical protein
VLTLVSGQPFNELEHRMHGINPVRERVTSVLVDNIEYRAKVSASAQQAFRLKVNQQAQAVALNVDVVHLPPNTRVIVAEDIPATVAEFITSPSMRLLQERPRCLHIATDHGPVIVVSLQVLKTLLSGSIEFETAAHSLRHELCHAIDVSARKQFLVSFESLGPKYVQRLASLLWMEFIANKDAYLPGVTPCTKDFDFFINTVCHCRGELVDAAVYFDETHQAALNDKIFSICLNLVEAIGYAAGTAAARHIGYEAHPAGFKLALHEDGFEDIYKSALAYLTTLATKRPWTSETDLAPLSHLVFRIYAAAAAVATVAANDSGH